MSLETAPAKVTSDVVDKSVKLTETTIKRAWAILDAASEKRSPTEYLSQKAINAIQGKSTN